MRRRITTSVGAEEPVEGIMQAEFFFTRSTQAASVEYSAAYEVYTGSVAPAEYTGSLF